MKVYKFVITNVPIDKQKEVIEALLLLIQKGIIKTTDVHFREEEV